MPQTENKTDYRNNSSSEELERAADEFSMHYIFCYNISMENGMSRHFSMHKCEKTVMIMELLL
jgi:hypothetical protein